MTGKESVYTGNECVLLDQCFAFNSFYFTKYIYIYMKYIYEMEYYFQKCFADSNWYISMLQNNFSAKKFTAFMLVKGKQHNKCITLTHVKLVILSFSVFSFSDDTFLIEKRHDILLIYCFCWEELTMKSNKNNEYHSTFRDGCYDSNTFKTTMLLLFYRHLKSLQI